ncbi:beta-1,3-N-acetylglucosaminyltransferase radical fringe isoform X1 [Microcaecilia unicolor]|uniref:Beta-1,3-N-acetylglucosaminyltransferase n=1 Tax=Microcaecilia unicolor TaxID=1415580 RepID=A0A6P7YE06_9AMPH|nr:beta-1,3-N-acetylglucosaminyltransferase radical fringe isoform X1 [Microcaecilia unicolor]
MNFSCMGLSKLCFLLSVVFCTLILLLIPQFHTHWKSRHYPLPAFNGKCEKNYTLRQQLSSEIIAHFGANENPEKWKGYSLDTGTSHLKSESLQTNTSSPLDSMLKNLSMSVSNSEKEILELKEIFIAVKTTRKYHKTRLDLLIKTWISRAKQQTYIFTDWEDQELRQLAGDQMINTNCSSVHTRQALCCKMAVEYDKFIESSKKWFCHVDDDNYVNLSALHHLLAAFSHSQDVYLGRPSLDHPIEAADRVRSDGSTSVKFWFATGGAGFCISRGLALKMSPWASMGNFISTAEKMRLPDDCTIGYIIEGLLEVKLLHVSLFHSHLENLQRLRSILKQVTLSYGGPENQHNVVSIGRIFNLQQDPTRFRSLHCLLYPDTAWCPAGTRL